MRDFNSGGLADSQRAKSKRIEATHTTEISANRTCQTGWLRSAGIGDHDRARRHCLLAE